MIAIADGFAQATGLPVLVNMHTSASGNGMGNLVTAFQNKSPLIVTAGNQTREMLLLEPFLTNVEATLLPQPWVKWSYQPMRAEDVPGAFMRAIATALQPPSGPVFLSLPLDDWEKPCVGPAAVRMVSRRIAPDPARLAEFAKTLSEASSPVLIYGGGVARVNGWEEGVAFAETLGAPVWAAPNSERAPFPETHPLYAGGLPPAIKPACEKLEGHDVILVVGAPVFRYYPYLPGTYIPNGSRLLHISDDPGETARAPVGDSLLGDSALALAGLIELLGKSKPKTHKARQTLPQRTSPTPPSVATNAKDGLLTAAQVYAALAEIRPAHAVVAYESESNEGDLHAVWPITEPDTFFKFASGVLGFALPAAVGIALAERDTGRNRPVTAFIGDGAYQYAQQSVWSAAQLHLPLLIVVFRNGEYCVLKSFALLEETPGVPGLDIPDIDIVSLAKGYGADAVRLDNLDAIKKVATEAWSKLKPTLIEIPISPKVPPLL